MIALDIGGTKTSIFFSKKDSLFSFEEKWNEIIKEVNIKQKYCVIPTFFNKNEKEFRGFFSYIKSLDEEIVCAFPGIVRIEESNGQRKFKVFSKKFPFMVGKYLDVNFAVNDVYAFAYFHAKKFFGKSKNRGKSILSIQIGTGVNAVHMNYYDYKNLLFLNKIFEAGHITMRQGKEVCFCGKNGCAELYISGKFLEKLGKGNPQRVFSNTKLKRVYYENLSGFVGSLVLLFSPDKIVFGGGVAKSLDLALIYKLIEKNFPYFKLHLNIEYEKDTSRISNLKGVVYLYRRFVKKSNNSYSITSHFKP